METSAVYLVRAEEFRNLIHDLMAGAVVEGHRDLCAMGLFRICLAHHEALCLLFAKPINSSAFALLRPCTDAGLRAMYVSLRSTPELLEKILEDDKNAFGQYVHMVDKIADSLKHKPLFFGLKEMWGELSSFTHGGFVQIDRQFHPDGTMTENFKDEERVSAIVVTTFVVAICAHFFLAVYKGEASAKITDQYYRNNFPPPFHA